MKSDLSLSPPLHQFFVTITILTQLNSKAHQIDQSWTGTTLDRLIPWPVVLHHGNLKALDETYQIQQITQNVTSVSYLDIVVWHSSQLNMIDLCEGLPTTQLN